MLKKDNSTILVSVFTLIAVLVIVLVPALAQYNYDHVNVTTTVNITNAGPEILSLEVNGGQNITLSAGFTKIVYCNSTIRDWNGFDDINNVNATFYYYLNSSDQQDDGNEHYTNTTCTEINNDGQYLANYSCSFEVDYFAYNGSWTCNTTAIDDFAFVSTLTNTTGINSLYALNVTDVINYGNLSVFDTSDNITATVTNFGNANMNISVLGYGAVEGDGIGLVCTTGSNISVGNQKYSWNASVNYTGKTNLTSTNVDVGLTLPRQTDDLTQIQNDTYWQLYVPLNPFGVCNGTVRFTATAP